MSQDDHNGLTPEEREWMDRVPERIDPPAQLRDRVVATLKSAGDLTTEPARRRHAPAARTRTLAVAAGLVLAFLAGAGGVAGRLTAPGDGTGTPTAGEATRVVPSARTAGETRFILLLYQDEGYQAGDRTFEQLAAEYGAWGQRMVDEDMLILAEKLGDDGWVVPFPDTAAGTARAPIPATAPALTGDHGELTGFFVIRASDYEEAARLARISPHTAYGGRIVIRQVDPI